MSRRMLLADVALLWTTLVWGATFVVVKDALQSIRPFAFLAVRFAIACLILLPFYVRQLRRGGLRQAGRGSVIGVLLFLGYATQTLGLELTTASKAGFITGLAVVIVPLLATVLLRQPPRPDSLIGVALATGGLAALTLSGSLAPGAGDLLVLMCAFFFAMHVIAVGHYNSDPDSSSGALATLQIGATSLLAAACSVVFERGYWAELGWSLAAIPGRAWAAIAVTAVLATAGAFLVQNIAQRHTTPTRTALILAMEPVFAALTAWLVAGETLGLRGILGGGLVLAGMLSSELEPWRRLRGKLCAARGAAAAAAAAAAAGADAATATACGRPAARVTAAGCDVAGEGEGGAGGSTASCV
jgi:drug/metabolite transporter (DMT)-like permease